MPDPAAASRFPHALRPGAIGALELPRRTVRGLSRLARRNRERAVSRTGSPLPVR